MIKNRTNTGKPTDDFIRIQDLWGMFIPKWYWFATSLFVALATASLYLLSTPNVYTRTAAILIKDDSKNNSPASAMNEFADMGIFKSNTNINNELLTLKSPTLMTEVVKRLGLNEIYTIRRGLKRIELYKSSPILVTYLFDNKKSVSFDIEVGAQNKFYLSNFIVAGEETGERFEGIIGDSIQTSAGTLAISLTSQYENLWIQDKNQIAVSTSRFIGERLGVIENELGHVDENISSYKSEHLLPDVQAASNLYMSQSAENKKEIQALTNQLTTAQYIRRELNSKEMNQPLPTNSGIANVNIESQIGEYNKIVLDRNRLIANSSEKNPLVKDLGNSMQSMKRTILQSVDNLIVSLNTQIRSIRQQEVATTQQLASNPSQAKYLLSVERQQKVKEELYLYLLQKREENELSQAFTAYNTRVITAPRGSALPMAPNKKNILLVAFALGLLVPAVIIFMQENMNTKVRGKKDLENLSVPYLGEIPLYSNNKKKKNKSQEKTIVVEEGNRNIINEAFRVLRSNVDFMKNKNTDQKVFVITSFNPGSGKSFFSVNIATSFAIKGKKVLVIDGDLRHGSISAYVGSPKKGLSDYLGNRVANWNEALVIDKKHANLHVLPVGTIPPNPTELLEDEKFATLMQILRNEYDYIFVDCPPIDIVADTQIIEQYADRTLFVVRAGLLDRSLLSELESIYLEKRFKNLSVILNGTESTGGRYSYRYGYSYGYHNGYTSYYGNSK